LLKEIKNKNKIIIISSACGFLLVGLKIITIIISDKLSYTASYTIKFAVNNN